MIKELPIKVIANKDELVKNSILGLERNPIKPNYVVTSLRINIIDIGWMYRDFEENIEGDAVAGDLVVEINRSVWRCVYTEELKNSLIGIQNNIAYSNGQNIT